jgi:hypothetical protein
MLKKAIYVTMPQQGKTYCVAIPNRLGSVAVIEELIQGEMMNFRRSESPLESLEDRSLLSASPVTPPVSSIVQAEATLNTAETSWMATIQADSKAIQSASNPATLAADIAKLETDQTAAHTAIQADIAALDAAISAGTVPPKAPQIELTPITAPISIH